MRIRLASATMLTMVLAFALLSGCWPCPKQDCSDCPKDCSGCPEVQKETGVTVELVKNCTVEPHDMSLSSSPDKANHVRWHNQTQDKQTVTFNASYWPFMEAQEDIVLKPGAYSAWYTVSSETIQRPYKISPLYSSGCPPDEPNITVGP